MYTSTLQHTFLPYTPLPKIHCLTRQDEDDDDAKLKKKMEVSLEKSYAS